jgi:hypothetical protein
MRTVGGEDGCSYMTTDFCLAEFARSARSLLLLQRARRTIPASEPSAKSALASCDTVAYSESSEAVVA